MDTSTINILTEMGTSLAILIAKGTATSVVSKINSMKIGKDVNTLRTTYDEIVNQLLSEREEAIRIAQAYKEELEKVEISDEDIKHLHHTVSAILTIFRTMSPQDDTINAFEQLKNLITVDTLKTMQLLGFNYKAAIGEPLTKLCANAIENICKKSNNKKYK